MITVSVTQKEKSHEVLVGFSSSRTASGTSGTSACLIISRTPGIGGSLCASPRAATSPTLVLVATGFYRSHQKNVQDRRKSDLVLSFSLQLKLCKIWAWWRARSSSLGLSSPGPSASSTASTRYVCPSSSPMLPAGITGARMVIPWFRAKKAQIIEEPP